MKNIKLYEEFIFEGTISKTPEYFLDLDTETFSPELGVKTLPKVFQNASMHQKAGGVAGKELDLIVDAFDWPMNNSDAEKVSNWIEGNGWSGSLGGNYKEFGPLKERLTQKDGVWYPAVEGLRVAYNIDESGETLSSTTKKWLGLRDSLIEAYKYWIDAVNGKI